jgi:hypothetical protein
MEMVLVKHECWIDSGGNNNGGVHFGWFSSINEFEVSVRQPKALFFGKYFIIFMLSLVVVGVLLLRVTDHHGRSLFIYLFIFTFLFSFWLYAF